MGRKKNCLTAQDACGLLACQTPSRRRSRARFNLSGIGQGSSASTLKKIVTALSRSRSNSACRYSAPKRPTTQRKKVLKKLVAALSRSRSNSSCRYSTGVRQTVTKSQRKKALKKLIADITRSSSTVKSTASEEAKPRPVIKKKKTRTTQRIPVRARGMSAQTKRRMREERAARKAAAAST